MFRIPWTLLPCRTRCNHRHHLRDRDKELATYKRFSNWRMVVTDPWWPLQHLSTYTCTGVVFMQSFIHEQSRPWLLGLRRSQGSNSKVLYQGLEAGRHSNHASSQSFEAPKRSLIVLAGDHKSKRETKQKITRSQNNSWETSNLAFLMSRTAFNTEPHRRNLTCSPFKPFSESCLS